MHELRIDRGRQLLLQRRYLFGHSLKPSDVLLGIDSACFVTDERATRPNPGGEFVFG